MNLPIKRQSVVFGWALSYLLIMLVPILFAGMTYFVASRTIAGEVVQSNQFLLEVLQQDLDTLQQDMEKLSLAISFDPQIMDGLGIEQPIFDSQYYIFYQATNRLKSFSLIYPHIIDFWVYYRQSGQVVSYRASVSGKDWFQQQSSVTDAHFSEWKSCLDNKTTSGFYRSDRLGYPDDQGGYITYSVTFPAYGAREASAVCLVMIDRQQLVERLQQANKLSNVFSCILDRDGTILVATESIENSNWLVDIDLAKSTELVQTEIVGQPYLLVHQHDRAARWHYVSLIPESVFWQKASYIRSVALVSLVLCLLLGCLLSVWLIRRHYNPVRLLISFFRDKEALPLSGQTNEYQYLEQAIGDEMRKSATLHEQLAKQENALRDYYLTCLVKGNFQDNIAPEDALAAHQIRMEYDTFTVAILYVLDYDSSVFNRAVDDQTDEAGLIRFILHNVFSEILSRKGQAFLIDVDDTVIALVNGDKDDLSANIRSGLTEGENFLRSHYGLRLILSVSKHVNQFAMIPQAYRQSIEALEYAILIGKSGVFAYSDMTDTRTQDICFIPIEQEHQLISLIQNGQEKAAFLLIDDLFDQAIQPEALSAQSFRCLLYQSLGMLTRAVQNMNFNSEHQIGDPVEQIRRLTVCRNLEDLKKELRSQVSLLCRLFYQQKEHNLIQRKVTRIIDEQYADPDLSLSQIAEQLDLHPVYLSREYKMQAGIGLLDSINSRRVQQACILLIDKQELTVEEIARMIGYLNVRTFTRVFNRYEGIAPGRYRDIHRQKSN